MTSLATALRDGQEENDASLVSRSGAAAERRSESVCVCVCVCVCTCESVCVCGGGWPMVMNLRYICIV